MGFLVSNKLVEIEIEYVELGESDVIIVKTDAQKKLFEGHIKKIKAKLERPKFYNFNIYISGCTKETSSGIEVDAMKLRENKFMTLLREVADENGNPVKLDGKFYRNVHPDFAVAIIESYDEAINKERMDYLEKMGIFDKIKEEEEKEEKVLAEEEKEEPKEESKTEEPTPED